MSQHRTPRRERTSVLLLASVGVTAVVVGAGVTLSAIGSDPADGSVRQGAMRVAVPRAAPTEPPRTAAVEREPRRQVQRGGVIRKQTGPELVRASTGRDGTGLSLAPLTAVDAPVGTTVRGQVRVAVANIPNRTSSGGFASSLRTLTADGADFVTLNEVSNRSIEAIRAAAPGYDAYRDPVPDRSTGGSQSMNNVVMWRTDRWQLVDGGRLKVVDNDVGRHNGRRFVWDRYATWAVLQRKEDGAIMSVLSTHMPTNPGKFPAQPGGASMSRVERYSRGMDVLVGSVRALAAHGPVLVGGDMNSHHKQGAWTAAAKMTAAGFGYVKDRGVMHLFYQDGVDVVGHRQVGVASDHPAIITTLDMSGQGPS